MTVVDCFTFFNELDLLEIRLNELDSAVDYFVIVEAERSHQNKPKPLFYKELADTRFKQWKDKIISVVVPAEDFVDDTWRNENNQFRAIRYGLSQFSDDDVIMVGAADEIPKVESIPSVVNTPMCFNQKLYYFYLNTLYNHHGSTQWSGTTIQKLSDIPEDLYDIIRNRSGFAQILDGGWHFSYLGDAKNAMAKLANFAHDEFSHLTEQDLQQFIANLSDPVGRGGFSSLNKIETVECLPKYVQANLEKFRKHIR
jgi:beta-1,4-mannosyl-glycoprotein beta-1,4-N-acetylglucosaminyltransferase